MVKKIFDMMPRVSYELNPEQNLATLMTGVEPYAVMRDQLQAMIDKICFDALAAADPYYIALNEKEW